MPLSKAVDPISGHSILKGVQLFCVNVVYIYYRFETMGNGSGSLLDIVSLKGFSLVSYSFHLLYRDCGTGRYYGTIR
jgi:hypothetical protein